MRIVKVSFIICQLLFFIVFNIHSLHIKGSSNQTGLDVIFWGIVFLLFGFILLLISKFKSGIIGKLDRLNVLISLISILTGLNFILFDYFNIMIEYERWLAKGMPVKAFWF